LNLERILSELKSERDTLDKAIEALQAMQLSSGGGGKTRAGRRRTHRLTPEGRRRLSEMMKKRWAERRKRKAA